MFNLVNFFQDYFPLFEVLLPALFSSYSLDFLSLLLSPPCAILRSPVLEEDQLPLLTLNGTKCSPLAVHVRRISVGHLYQNTPIVFRRTNVLICILPKNSAIVPAFLVWQCFSKSQI